MFLEQFCAFLSVFKLDTFSLSHGTCLASAMQYEYREHIFIVLGVMACLDRPIDQVSFDVASNHVEPHFG